MWRDPGPNAGRTRDKAPTGILLSANFGIAPYELTNSLAETAEMFNTLDRANLGLVFRAERPWRLPTGFAKARVIRSDKEPASFLFLLERERVGGRRLCRADRSACDAQRSAAFPPPRPIAATLHSWCRNEDQYVSFTAPGGAMPMPDWVNY